MRFKVGDIVKISKQSRFYGRSKRDPKDIEGEVIRNDIYGPYSIRVKWYNKETFIYREKDLRLVRRNNE